jgi:PKHD-type hydroxylase
MLVMIPDVLDWTELKEIRKTLATGDFADGRATAGKRAKQVKKNLQLERDAPGAARIKELVVKGLKRNPAFRRAVLPKTIRTPLISRYAAGMTYGWHVDDALMGRGAKTRSDVSVTVFLSDPSDYDGGELVMESPFGRQEVKLPAGAAVVYPSLTLHRVAPVEQGERLAAVTWVQSYVRDPGAREILHDVQVIRDKLAALAPEAEETDLAYKTYANLLRRWSE